MTVEDGRTRVAYHAAGMPCRWWSFSEGKASQTMQQDNKNNNFGTEKGELASSRKLIREPLQSSLDYGSLLRSAYSNASKRRVDFFNSSMSGSVMATRFHEVQR